MTSSVVQRLSKGLLVSITLAALAVVHRYAHLEEEEEHPFQRMLYESDDDKDCLESEGCRFMLGLYLLVSTPLVIFWNEHQFVKLETLYNTAKKFIHDLNSPRLLSDTMNGKFACFSGRLKGETTLWDDLFPCVKIDSTLLLIREIEILQYYQTKKKDEKPELKQKWFTSPQRDPHHFPNNKNNNGNWKLFSDNTRMVDTGDKFDGDSIQFGDNVVVFQAPNVSIGDVALPEALMKEAFMGERYVHRLGELEVIRASQGVSETFGPMPKSMNPQSTELVSEGVYYCHQDGEYVYDGATDQIGTIRLKWRFVKPQDMTVAAELVAPGRPCLSGYGTSRVRNLQEAGAYRKMILQDVLSGFREDEPLLLAGTDGICKHDAWTVTPFRVMAAQWFPPSSTKFIGRLWLYSPGRLSSSELFRKAHRASSYCLWKVRGLCYIGLFIGWCLVFEPLTNIFRIPFLQSLLSLAFATFAFVLATSCCLTCTAISRITARPGQSILAIATIWVIIAELSARLDTPVMDNGSLKP